MQRSAQGGVVSPASGAEARRGRPEGVLETVAEEKRVLSIRPLVVEGLVPKPLL